MAIRSPWTPIFNVKIRRGAILPGATPGTPVPQPIVLDYDTTQSTGTQVSFLLNTPVDLTIDWGDSSTSAATSTGYFSHTYSGEGQYTVTISADSPTGSSLVGFEGASSVAHGQKLVGVQSWGTLGMTRLQYACYGAAAALSSVASPPDTVTDVYRMFYGAAGFNADISGWDTSNILDMSNVFESATDFNQSLDAWDVSSVQYMARMFYAAADFNQSLNSWDVSSVTTMQEMFAYATTFNGNITSWTTTSLANTGLMFAAASAFNQNIGGWDMSNVTTAAAMFQQASAFDGNIGNWDFSSCTSTSDLAAFFYDATSFNQDCSGWCVTNVGSTPLNFDTGASSWVTARPVWGTCP